MADEPGAIARLTLAIRGITDTAERQAAISARLSLAVEGYTDELIYQRRRAEEIERLQSEVPAVFPQRNTIILPASGIDSIDLGGPETGRSWVLQSLAVGGVSATTVAAGTADVYQNPTDPDETATDLTSWRDHAATLPLVGWYTGREVVLRHPDRLWIVISGGTSGQQYAAAAWWLSYQDGGYVNVVTL